MPFRSLLRLLILRRPYAFQNLLKYCGRPSVLHANGAATSSAFCNGVCARQYATDDTTNKNANKSSKAPKDRERAEEMSKLRMQQIAEYYSQYEKEYSSTPVSSTDSDELKDEDELPAYTPQRMERGKAGVFDIEELVDWLQAEKALDIAVIKIPRDYGYCRHMVIVSVLSVRHLNALLEHLSKAYKLKRGPQDPESIYVEGSRFKADWRAIDLSNIVLHVMQPEIRRRYDLEQLWCVGPEFDELTHEKTEVDKWEEMIQAATIPTQYAGKGTL